MHAHAICKSPASIFPKIPWSIGNARSNIRPSSHFPLLHAKMTVFQHFPQGAARAHHFQTLLSTSFMPKLPFLSFLPFNSFLPSNSIITARPALRGNGTDSKKRPFLPILMLHFSLWQLVSTASASLLAAHCILAPKHANNNKMKLISFAKDQKLKKSTVDDMLYFENWPKIVPNLNATSGRESPSKTSATASFEAIDTESLTSQDLLEWNWRKQSTEPVNINSYILWRFCEAFAARSIGCWPKCHNYVMQCIALNGGSRGISANRSWSREMKRAKSA